MNENKHHSILLQRATAKYGIENFVFEVLDYVTNPKNLIHYEQLWMDQLKPEYNICKVAGSVMTGRNHTKESKNKISQANSGENSGVAKLTWIIVNTIIHVTNIFLSIVYFEIY